MSETDGAWRERSLPFNEDAEKALLGALILNNAILDRVGFLAPEHFFIPVHGRIYEACQQLVGRGQVANPITLKTVFEEDDSLSDVGGAGYLAWLAGSAPTTIGARDYATQVVECFRRRRLISIGEGMILDGHNLTLIETAQEQVERAEQALFELGQDGAGGEAVPVETSFDAMLDQARSYASGSTRLIRSGFFELDGLMVGMAPGELIVLAARPAMGKSAAAQAISRFNLSQSVPVAWLQLEMSHQQMMAREVSQLTGIPVNAIQFGNLDRQEWEMIEGARSRIAKMPLRIDDRAGLHIDQVLPRARNLVRRNGAELLVIDYMGLLRFNAARGRYEGLTTVSGRLKETARSLGIPVLALHQLSRANEQRDNKRPTLSDLRDSGAIEQDADKVIFVHRDDYYLAREEPDPDDFEAHFVWREEMAKVQGKAEMILAKHRQGPTGVARCRFDAVTATFTNGN